MLTTRSAAPLLAAIASPRGPAAVLTQLGFSPAGLLDRATANAIGAPETAARVSSARRAGVLRALVLVSGDGRPLRELLAAVIPRMARMSPEFAWLLIAVRGDGGEAAISTWIDDGSKVRRATLHFEPAGVRESDAETLSALAAAAAGEDTVVHLRWQEILGREALSSRFYRALEHSVVSLGEGAQGSAPSEARRILALTTVSRLLFLSFLQARGWLDGDSDFLVRQVDAHGGARGGLQRRVLEPLFFGTLNTRVTRRAAAARRFGRVPFLNGGLFARSPVECRYRSLRFRDEEITALFDDVLTKYRFTAHEERTTASEAAVDPEMLGRAFEGLMASRDRRDSGAFYTPQSLVERTVDAALHEILDQRGLSLAQRQVVLGRPGVAAESSVDVRHHLTHLRVLDPACGSGAFLVHLLDRLTEALLASGDTTPRAMLKRRVLTRSVFGVDINPMAVWLCELRLWLSTVIDLEVEDPMQVPPLPNLDRNVRVGDSLHGGQWIQLEAHEKVSQVATLRARYARATGRKKALLAKAVDGAERRAALAVLDRRLASLTDERWSLLAVSRGRDLFGGRRGSLGAERARRLELRRLARSLRAQRRSLTAGGALPFRFASHFADALQAGGFDAVVGNPPWVRLHRIPPDQREALRRRFRVFRDAAWQRGDAANTAPGGFAAQVDLAALFVEQAMNLVRRDGTVALLLPMKLWRSLAGGGTRRLVREEYTLRVLEDWSDAPASFDAAVYPSLVVARRAAPPPHDATVQVTVHKRRLAIGWSAPYAHLGFDATPGSPWVVLPPDARRAFARLAAAGPPLGASSLGSPLLGVKCGCNDAFLVSAPEIEAGETVVASTRGNVRIDSSLLRPILRGEHVRRWRPLSTAEWIVWTHGRDGRALPVLPPATARWMARWRSTLTARADARGNGAWWSLFRVDGALSDRPRVVWADMSRGPRATVLPVGSPVIPLNTCYVLPCRDDADAGALVALLNSPLIGAWLDAIAEPARGGYRRYLAWTVACAPLPSDWDRARRILAPIGARGVAGGAVGDAELFDATCEAYGVGARTVAPLVEWMQR